MKHLSAAMLVLLMLAAPGFAQYDYGREYDNDGYSDVGDYDDSYLAWDYGYDNARYYLDRYDGPVYYWAHPYRDVYFVLVGPRVFVIPVYEISRFWHRLRWSLVSMSRFVHLSCFGLPYYDNYVRFNYYFNHYRRYRFNRYYNSYLRNRYRSYFHNRRHNRNYYRHRDSVLRSRGWKYHRDHRRRMPRKQIERKRLDTRRVVPRNNRNLSRYDSRRSPARYSSSRTVKRSRVNTRITGRKGSRKVVVRKSTAKKSRSMRGSSQRKTSSRTVRRSRSTSKARANRKARRK